MIQPPRLEHYRQLIELAKAEDLGLGDVTSEVTIPASAQGSAAIVFRQDGMVCGMPVVAQVLHAYDSRLLLTEALSDGDMIRAGQSAGNIRGPLRALLAAERVVLNFLQRLSAIALLTSRYVQAVGNSRAAICDTRKTTPGWRELEKYAVRCGGGVNHRSGLYDAVLIKDNHLAAAGAGNLRQGILEALSRLQGYPRSVDFIQVEVDTLEQFDTVLTIEGIDMILLDNMTCAQLSQAVSRRDEAVVPPRQVLLEASGGITLTNVAAVARTGVDRISIGALTHAVCNLDIALDLQAYRHA